MQYVEEAVKYESSEPRVEVARPTKYNEKPAKQVEPERISEYIVGEKARGGGKRQSDSFDELFGGVQEQRTGNQRSKYYAPNLAPIPQNHSEGDNSQPPNTYY